LDDDRFRDGRREREMVLGTNNDNYERFSKSRIEMMVGFLFLRMYTIPAIYAYYLHKFIVWNFYTNENSRRDESVLSKKIESKMFIRFERNDEKERVKNQCMKR